MPVLTNGNLLIAELLIIFLFNYVCTARSGVFGDVVLKVGCSPSELISEVHALKAFVGNNGCKCLDFDADLNAIVMERILPGEDLYSIINIEKQIEIGVDIIADFPTSEYQSGLFDSYGDWLSRAFSFQRNNPKTNQIILKSIEKAESYYRLISQSSDQLKLCHGDLHHQNIISAKDGSWKIIDPKGILAFPVLESGRFIRNQLFVLNEADPGLYQYGICQRSGSSLY